ncbi:delta-endotoxin CytB [Schizophyllum commune]
MSNSDATNEMSSSGDLELLDDKRATPRTFETVINLLPEFATAAKELARQAGLFVVVSGSQGAFHWPSFKMAVNKHAGGSLTFVNHTSLSVPKEQSSVSSVAQKIADIISNDHKPAVDPAAVRTMLEATFTNLRTAKGWLDFNPGLGPGRTSWEYRLLFAVPLPVNVPADPKRFRAIITTTTLEASIDTKEKWWDLLSSSEEDFSATVDVMELLVSKDFSPETPLKPTA